MIKAKLGDTLILGLEEENIKRLKENKPIVFDMAIFGMEGKMVLMYGETQEVIKTELQVLTGVSLQPPKAH